MPECACGCGEITAGGTYRPGHDRKLLGRIEESVGGLQALDDLVREVLRHADGEISADELSGCIRRTLNR